MVEKIRGGGPLVYSLEDMNILVQKMFIAPVGREEIADCLKIDRSSNTWRNKVDRVIMTMSLSYAVTDVKHGFYKIMTREDYDAYERQRVAELEIER